MPQPSAAVVLSALRGHSSVQSRSPSPSLSGSPALSQPLATMPSQSAVLFAHASITQLPPPHELLSTLVSPVHGSLSPLLAQPPQLLTEWTSTSQPVASLPSQSA